MLPTAVRAVQSDIGGEPLCLQAVLEADCQPFLIFYDEYPLPRPILPRRTQAQALRRASDLIRPSGVVYGMITS